MHFLACDFIQKDLMAYLKDSPMSQRHALIIGLYGSLLIEIKIMYFFLYPNSKKYKIP